MACYKRKRLKTGSGPVGDTDAESGTMKLGRTGTSLGMRSRSEAFYVVLKRWVLLTAVYGAKT
jgi:hypothetical protein